MGTATPPPGLNELNGSRPPDDEAASRGGREVRIRRGENLGDGHLALRTCDPLVCAVLFRSITLLDLFRNHQSLNLAMDEHRDPARDSALGSVFKVGAK